MLLDKRLPQRCKTETARRWTLIEKLTANMAMRENLRPKIEMTIHLCMNTMALGDD